MSKEVIKQALESADGALRRAAACIEKLGEENARLRQAIAEAERVASDDTSQERVDETAKQRHEQEPVAWRDHVEQRLLTWRQSFVNRNGDQLAIDDFMDKRSIDDLIDFVCDEYTTPPQRQPLTDEQIQEVFGVKYVAETFIEFVRAIEAAHGIKGQA